MMRVTSSVGEILTEEYKKPGGFNNQQLAKFVGINRNKVIAILKGGRSISKDEAKKLAKAFLTTEAFWLNLEKNHFITKQGQ